MLKNNKSAKIKEDNRFLKMKKQFIKNLLKKIDNLAKRIKREVKLMEVCGTHTQTVVRYGIRKLMPENVKLTTGPGCPVCVTPQQDIDAAVNLALAGVPLVSYGDVLRVPGYYGSLDQARSQGCWVKEVYSIEEALKYQKEKPDLVFFGIGFETTAPMSALAIKQGLVVYSAHKLFFSALVALLEIKKLRIDGFICPGHVSTIIGSNPYKKLKVPQVISGFEPEDVLLSIYLLLKQISENKAKAENEYTRSVKSEGNLKAKKLIFEVFDAVDSNWRGLGRIPKSGLEIKKRYSNFDAKRKYRSILSKIDFTKSKISSSCCCSEIILGLKEPKDCPLFRKICQPQTPQGPCMVSVEGACWVEFNYS